VYIIDCAYKKRDDVLEENSIRLTRLKLGCVLPTIIYFYSSLKTLLFFFLLRIMYRRAYIIINCYFDNELVISCKFYILKHVSCNTSKFEIIIKKLEINILNLDTSHLRMNLNLFSIFSILVTK